MPEERCDDPADSLWVDRALRWPIPAGFFKDGDKSICGFQRQSKNLREFDRREFVHCLEGWLVWRKEDGCGREIDRLIEGEKILSYLIRSDCRARYRPLLYLGTLEATSASPPQGSLTSSAKVEYLFFERLIYTPIDKLYYIDQKKTKTPRAGVEPSSIG